MALRFAGQESKVATINTTSGEAVAPDINVESSGISIDIELTEKEFLGEVGKDFREFYNGVSGSMKCEPNDPQQAVDLLNLVIAKAQGLITDECAYTQTFTAPDVGSFKITARDIHWDSIPLDMASRTDFLEIELKWKAKKIKVEKL